MVSRLEALAGLARTGPSQLLDDAWRAFAADLEAELTVRERQANGRAYRGPAQRERARGLTQEHAAIRALVETIGRQVAHRRVRPATIELLAEILGERVAIATDDAAPRRADVLL
jgi:hypothetical protein